MNFEPERNKPLFIVRKPHQALKHAVGPEISLTIPEMVVGHLSQDLLVKPAAAKQLNNRELISVDDASDAEIKDLVVTRLEMDGEEKFEFLDGTTYTGREAAAEVRQDGPMGEYFLELEKETLRIVQEAYSRGAL